MLYTSGPRSAGGPAAGRSARARALQTNLGVTGHPGPAAEARLVMSKKLAHIYTRLDAAPGGSRAADPWPSDVPGLEPGGPAASQHRPTSDGSAEGPCHSKAEKLVIFLKKKKKKKLVIFLKKKIYKKKAVSFDGLKRLNKKKGNHSSHMTGKTCLADKTNLSVNMDESQ